MGTPFFIIVRLKYELGTNWKGMYSLRRTYPSVSLNIRQNKEMRFNGIRIQINDPTAEQIQPGFLFFIAVVKQISNGFIHWQLRNV